MKHRDFKQAGFTLMELMIVVIVIGILASVAMPSYQNYVKKSRARAATADLVALAAAVESVFQRTLTYPSKEELAAIAIWQPSSDKFFDYTYSPDKYKTTYTLNASGKGVMKGCNLELKNDNTRSVSSATACGFGSW